MKVPELVSTSNLNHKIRHITLLCSSTHIPARSAIGIRTVVRHVGVENTNTHSKRLTAFDRKSQTFSGSRVLYFRKVILDFRKSRTHPGVAWLSDPGGTRTSSFRSVFFAPLFTTLHYEVTYLPTYLPTWVGSLPTLTG